MVGPWTTDDFYQASKAKPLAEVDPTVMSPMNFDGKMKCPTPCNV